MFAIIYKSKNVYPTQIVACKYDKIRKAHGHDTVIMDMLYSDG